MNSISHFSKLMLAVVATVTFNASDVRAHSDDYFDARPSPHGGQVRMSGAYHFELVMDEKAIVVYVTDHADQPIATTGAVGTLEIRAAGEKTVVDLMPGDGNILKSTSAWPGTLTPDLKAQLSVTFPNKKPSKAKFTPFAKPRK